MHRVFARFVIFVGFGLDSTSHFGLNKLQYNLVGAVLEGLADADGAFDLAAQFEVSEHAVNGLL